MAKSLAYLTLICLVCYTWGCTGYTPTPTSETSEEKPVPVQHAKGPGGKRKDNVGSGLAAGAQVGASVPSVGGGVVSGAQAAAQQAIRQARREARQERRQDRRERRQENRAERRETRDDGGRPGAGFDQKALAPRHLAGGGGGGGGATNPVTAGSPTFTQMQGLTLEDLVRGARKGQRQRSRRGVE